ncbi:MAG: hypothetical protein IT383_07825 [Deltaproteobacteria bacterium]|nr:hypothetical protein [Deltaproteobacteria bacterium]
MSARVASRAVLATAFVGGLVLVVGAARTLMGAEARELLLVGAALFLATPLARNAAVLAREGRRAPRLLALAGTVALLLVYAWAAWRLLG